MKYNKCLLVLSALAAVVFTGCKNEDVEKHRFDNKFYITSAILSDDLLIKSDTPGYTKTIESRLAKPAGQQVAVTIEADPSQVAAYNMIYGDNAVALPAECYELSSNQIDIAAGQVSGDAIEIVFKDINTLDGSRRYVLPVTVTSCNGVDLLDSRSTVYFVARQGAMINVADILEHDLYRVAAHLTGRNVDLVGREFVAFGGKRHGIVAVDHVVGGDLRRIGLDRHGDLLPGRLGQTRFDRLGITGRIALDQQIVGEDGRSDIELVIETMLLDILVLAAGENDCGERRENQ